jgi:hypothetical protein
MPKPKLKSIRGVEIFSAGVWNGDEYSEKDLDEMVRAFNDHPKQRPFLKLGHDNSQKLLQQDGLPAAGWIGNLYRKGKKLVADFIDLPEKIYELLERGAYRKVSAEIYWNAKIGEEMYRRVLGAVALLGADTPGVTNLNDIFEWYKLDGDPRVYDLEGKCFTIEIDRDELEEKGDAMNPEQIAKLQADLKAAQEALAAKSTEYSNSLKSMQDQFDALKKDFTKLDEAKKAAEEKAAEAELDKEVGVLISERVITPAMKPYIRALLGDEKKEYSLKVIVKKDDEEKTVEKKFSKAGLVKEILKLHSVKSKVNTDEGSEDGVPEREEREEGSQKARDLEIKAYAKKHGLTYKEAYVALGGEQSPDEDEDGDSEDEE